MDIKELEKEVELLQKKVDLMKQSLELMRQIDDYYKSKALPVYPISPCPIRTYPYVTTTSDW